MEDECIALYQDIRNLLTLRRLIQEVDTQLNMEFVSPASTHSKVFEDNNGDLGLATLPRTTLRMRHIAVKYQFFREHVG